MEACPVGSRRVAKTILRSDGRGCKRDTLIKKCVHTDESTVTNKINSTDRLMLGCWVSWGQKPHCDQ